MLRAVPARREPSPARLARAAGSDGAPLPSKYDLIANVAHEGSRASPQTGSYKSHVHRQSEAQWYEVQDLVVTDILPQVRDDTRRFGRLSTIVHVAHAPPPTLPRRGAARRWWR